MGEELNSRKAYILKGVNLMKKNKMMRIASILLVAVLLTTSIISGTFAKYVTTGSANDSARVAKFGVEVTATGSLFDKTYKKVADGNTPGGTTTESTDNTVLTVESSDKVVAPGTKNTDGLTFAFTGTPEVDVKITFAIQSGYKDVFLKGTSLPDKTTSGTGTFDLTGEYHPIKFTLKNGTSTVAEGTLSQIETELASKEIYVNAGTSLAADAYKYTLTWEWPFSDSTSTAGENVDKADTLLGDLAVGTVNGVDAGNYSTEVSLTIVATVTQVD